MNLNKRAFRLGYLDWQIDKAQTCRIAFASDPAKLASYAAGYAFAENGGRY